MASLENIHILYDAEMLFIALVFIYFIEPGFFFFIKTVFAELGYVVSFLGPQILCISINYSQTIFHSSVERKTMKYR